MQRQERRGAAIEAHSVAQAKHAPGMKRVREHGVTNSYPTIASLTASSGCACCVPECPSSLAPAPCNGGTDHLLLAPRVSVSRSSYWAGATGLRFQTCSLAVAPCFFSFLFLFSLPASNAAHRPEVAAQFRIATKHAVSQPRPTA